MDIKRLLCGTASFLAAGTTLAALAYGGVSLSGSLNEQLRTLRPSAAQAPASTTNGLRGYLVHFNAAPVAIYSGSIPGLAATNAHVLGRRMLDTSSGASLAYARYLEGQHQDFLTQAGRVLGRSLEPRHSFSYAYNGIAVRMTPSEALQLATLSGVESVLPDLAFKPTAVPIPASAASTEPSRAWIKAPVVWAKPTFATGVGGASNDNEGEGIVVADIDTGLNVANASFAATGADGYTISNPMGSGSYLGVCNSANTTASKPNTYDSTFACNSKVIGAYTYTRYSYLSTTPPGTQSNDPASPEDSEGHGSHTASTVAGNFVSSVTSVSGVTSPLSGVAPHANVIVYDVCDPTESCVESDSIAAIDQAIQDQSAIKTAAGSAFKGMVINFSIGGSADPYLDPVDQAFFSAEQAGIFVSAAGGNSGPVVNNSEGYGPVQHLAPWLMTVAASTDDSMFGANTLTVSGTAAPAGSPFNGQGSTGSYGPHEIVYAGLYTYSPAYYNSLSTSSKYPLSGQNYADPTKQTAAQAAAECLYPFTSGNYSPAITPGTILICDRGTIALVDKADNVKQGGAGAVVIVSQSGNPLLTESYEIPGTMVDNADGTSIETWVNSIQYNPGFTATLSGSTLSICDPNCSGIADQVAAFSSRGPNGNLYDNVVKPDVTAPGIQILAAVADPCDTTATSPGCSDGKQETYDFYQGTSMATPHDAGAAALLMQLRGWTPMEIKSALMSTAVTGLVDQCATSGVCNSVLAASASPQVSGAGRVNLADAARAGFIMDEKFTGQQSLITSNTDASAATLQGFNLPSLGNNQCIITCSWTRKITSTQASATLSYTVTVPSWMTVSVTGGAVGKGGNLSLAPRATATLTFAATLPQASWNSWVFGEVDFATGSNADDGSAAPAQHFAVAVYNQQPYPKIGVTPSSLSQGVTVGSSAQTQSMTISNSGQAALNWTVNNIATSTSFVSKSVVGASSGVARTEGSVSGPIVTRSPDGSQGQVFGYPSDFFTQDGHGIYEGDTFNMPVSGSVTSITNLGFTLTGTKAGTLADATQIAWYVYADSNGTPAGSPEGGGSALWSFTAPPTATGVNTSDGNDIVLDLSTAGAPALNLSVGNYWLVVVPTFNDHCSFTGGNIITGGCSNEAWYWDESAPGNGKGSVIDPANLLGAKSAATSWALIGPNTQTAKTASGSVSLAFVLAGTLNCSGATPMSGVTLAPASGSVAPGASATVTATFNPAGVKAGNYNGVVCVQGNDPGTPYTIVPVTEIVTPAPASSGGGGAMDLVGLSALFALLAVRSRRRVRF